MQQHTGEHVLGQAFYRLERHVVAVSMEHAVCTLDLAGEVSWEQAMQAEQSANEAIWSAHSINCQTRILHHCVVPRRSADSCAWQGNRKVRLIR